jgi:hypothetical protein
LPSSQAREGRLSAAQIPPPADSKDPARELDGVLGRAGKPGDALTFYAGPKDFDTLAAIDRNLVKAINFGMFSVIVGAAAAIAQLDPRLSSATTAGRFSS